MAKTEDPYKAMIMMHQEIAQKAALQPTAGIGIVISSNFAGAEHP